MATLFTPDTKPLLVGSGHGLTEEGKRFAAEIEEKRQVTLGQRGPEDVAQIVRDTEKAIIRLEKAASRGIVAPELVYQIKNELLSQVLAEAFNVETERARETLRGLYELRWHRHISRIETDRFKTVTAIRLAMTELVVHRDEAEFPAVARRLFDSVKDKFPAVDPFCRPQES